MNEEKIEFSCAGRVFGGFVVEQEAVGAALRPAVIVLHGGAGLGAHERERARMLADLGYVAFAPDLFGEVFENREHGLRVITGLVADAAVLRARLAAALACVRARPNVDAARVGAVGFCFGGLAALELARAGADVRAVVSFHGGLTAKVPALRNEIKAAVLACTGAADPFVTRDHREAFEEEMTNAAADWQLCVYANAMHGFTERNVQRSGAQYHEATDRRSWRAMCALFDEAFGRVESSTGGHQSVQQ